MTDRRAFLKTTGLLGVASLFPFGKALAAGSQVKQASCTLIPAETAGPFPLDLTANNFYFRQDVRETRAGVQLNQKIKIIGADNCAPMPNVRVNIWHCDKDGLYSGYNTETGLTYLRGYQITDANGEVEFITIFPGWYPGRICHIHFQVYVSSSYAAISQLTYPVAPKNALYSANPSIYTAGTDPVSLAGDGVFADGYAFQMATLTPNSSTGGYDSYLEVTVQGSGTVGVGHLERETAKQFTLGQNFPNPYAGETIVPITLMQPADVLIELWDLSGRKVAAVSKKGMHAGEQQITLNMKALGLPNANYVYQVEVSNTNGTYRQYKMMTAAK